MRLHLRSESSDTNWKDGLAVAADALGATEEAEALLAEYEARANEIGERVGADGTHLSMVRFLLPDEIGANFILDDLDATFAS